MSASHPPIQFVTRRRALGLAMVAVAAPLLDEAAFAASVVRPWPAARPVPGLDLADLDGKRWTLPGLAGKVVLLNFWATWCEPCRIEMPSLDALAERYRKRDLVILAVNYRESAAVIRTFLEHMPYKATILLDAEGDAAVEWTPRIFPSTVLIGRDGKPHETVLGDLDWGSAAARALVEPLLAAPSTT
ncbi:MAG: TlpA family protein disulfide reductase [Pseudomonadota bacterium]|nr:TlpA family protein disulfide reductase [Pseudomonadota bacterium]